MARRVACIVFALLPTLASAYSNTHPVVAWSSHSSNALDAASLSKSANPKSIFESILLNDHACEHDAVILVDQVGLHASDLRTLSPSSGLAQSLNVAPSTFELPYVRRSTAHPFSDFLDAVSERCGARVVNYKPGQAEQVPESKDKHVVCIEMPALGNVEGADRKRLMSEHESRLSSSLTELAAAFPKHLVVYAGWSPSLHARQSLSPFSPSSINSTSAFASPPGGILARYQLLTPGLILSLLVGFFLLIPIVMMGVSAVADIKSPLQGEPPKGYLAAEKKNQ